MNTEQAGGECRRDPSCWGLSTSLCLSTIRSVCRHPLNAARLAGWHLLIAAPGRHRFKRMIPQPRVVPRLLCASLPLSGSQLNLLGSDSVVMAKTWLSRSFRLCRAMAPLCPALCQVPLVWSPEGFWQEDCVALAGEGRLTQEDAVKIKQCCV